jgi:maltose/moltooligosaccharide transporter
MTTSTTLPAETEPKIFRCGTLSYSKDQLYHLFLWLMLNDFTINLLQDPIGFGGFLQRDLGATNTQIAVFGTIGGVFQLFINPAFSVWSDRTRTPWGRRRPFLMLFTPPLAFFIAVMPYMADFYHFLSQFSWAAALFKHVSTPGPIFMIGLCTICISIFNSIVGTLFSYLYWDVVPQEVLGRWTSLTKIVTAAAGFIWSFFFLGLADHHMKGLCLGVSLFSLIVYLISVWKVQEGDYAPVDKHVKGGRGFASIRAYFVECFSETYYIWIFASFATAAINWMTGNYIDFYLRYDLHLDYNNMGEMKAAPPLLIIVLGYFFGSMADRLHPLRIFAPTYFAIGLTYLGSYFFVHDKWSYLFWTCLTVTAQFANGITYGALLPQLFPREKFGQFCSANATTSALLCLLLGLPMGRLFDLLHSNYRVAYLIGAGSMFGASVMFMKVHRNYEARNGKIPVPHAG